MKVSSHEKKPKGGGSQASDEAEGVLALGIGEC